MTKDFLTVFILALTDATFMAQGGRGFGGRIERQPRESVSRDSLNFSFQRWEGSKGRSRTGEVQGLGSAMDFSSTHER